MTYNPAEQPLLVQYVQHKRIGVVTDMDGTISEFADTPTGAVVTPRALALLAALHEQIACVAVVSGRGAADLRPRVGLEQLTYMGNHGLERWQDGGVMVAPEALAYREALAAAMREFEPHLVPGMIVEDKTATISIHYRLADNPASVRETHHPILEQIAAQHGLTYFAGRMIFELRPPIRLNKGTAFQTLIEEHELDAAVFIGDDTTDADAMIVARALRAEGRCFALGMGVELPEMPAIIRDNADVFVPGITGVEDFLAWLVRETRGRT